MKEIKYIYEDDDILVCHKPAGVATEGARVGSMDVVSHARNYLSRKNRNSGKPSYVATVHRLDQPVEGVLVLAKNKNAASVIAKQIKDRTTEKYYYALCYGKPAAEKEHLSGNHAKTEDGLALIVSDSEKASLKDKVITKDNGDTVRLADQDIKKAELEYEVIASSENMSLLNIKLLTGRFHQIRVQLANLGHPIMGEKKYGTPESIALSEERGIKNMCLVSYKFVLTHPKTKKRMTFEITPDNADIKKMLG